MDKDSNNHDKADEKKQYRQLSSNYHDETTNETKTIEEGRGTQARTIKGKPGSETQVKIVRQEKRRENRSKGRK